LALQTLGLYAWSQPALADNFFTRWFASGELKQATVADPYLEMRTGPGVGYPVFYVVGRGEAVDIVTRRTDWFYVRTARQIAGWVDMRQMRATLEASGQPLEIKEPSRAEYTVRRYEAGAFAGRFGDASLIAVFGDYGLSPHLAAELSVAEAIGVASDARMATIGLNHIMAPEWRVSPYLGLGAGVIQIKPRATLVQAVDRTDQLGYAVIGARGYLSRRFLGRFEYRGNVVFTSRNENEALHEWKLGFAFFF